MKKKHEILQLHSFVYYSCVWKYLICMNSNLDVYTVSWYKQMNERKKPANFMCFAIREIILENAIFENDWHFHTCLMLNAWNNADINRRWLKSVRHFLLLCEIFSVLVLLFLLAFVLKLAFDRIHSKFYNNKRFIQSFEGRMNFDKLKKEQNIWEKKNNKIRR